MPQASGIQRGVRPLCIVVGYPGRELAPGIVEVGYHPDGKITASRFEKFVTTAKY